MAYEDFSPPANGRSTAAPTPDGEIVKGLRGGANLFMSGMNNALGGVAQPLGFDEFAQSRFKAGHEYEQQAQEVGPSIQSLRDVHGVGDFLRFGMGQVGQMAIPAAIGVGAGVLAKNPARGLAAATAAMTPETFGHAVGEFRRTNENAPVDPETALRLGGTALASSAIQNIVPASVGASLRGAGAAANAARGFVPTMKQAIATDIGGNALAGGAADVITQRGVNPDREVDLSRSIDAAATGGVMGVPFVGARAVAHGIHAAPRAGIDGAKDLFSSAKGKTTDAVGGYMDDVSSAAQRGAEWAGGVKDATSAAFRENSPHLADAADKVAEFVSSSAEEQIAKAKGMRDELMAAADEPAEVKQRIGKMGASLLNATDRQFVAAAKFLRDRKAKETTAPEEAAPLAVFEKLNKDLTDSADPAVDNILNDRPHDLDAEATAEGQARNDALSIEKVKEWGTSLLNTAGLTEEKRATITDALTNPESPAAQKAIALLKQGQDKASAFGSRVVDFGKSIDSYMMKHGPAKEAGVKKSEDYSGARSAIAEHIVPWLKENRPEALEGNIPALADNIRKFMVLAAEHRTDPLSPDVVHGITDLFGDDTVLLLSKVHDSLGTLDHAKAANYFRALNEIERSRRSIQSFSGFLAANAPEGSPAQKSAEALARILTSWATKQHAPNKGVVLDEVASQRAALENQRMDAFLETNFGEKAEAIKTALEEHVTRSRDEYAKQRTTASLLDEDGPVESDRVISEEPGHVDADGEYHGPVGEEALSHIVYKKSANSKAPDAMMNPDLFASSKQPGQNYAKQALADHRAAYPDHNVKWVSGDEMVQLTGQSYPGGKDHGYIIAEKAADPERLSPQDLKRMALKNSSTKSRIEVPQEGGGRLVLDAVRIKDVMLNRLPREEGMTFADREKAAFLAGAAELMRTYGKFDIPPDTVVSYTGGSALRFKDINKLARPQIEDRMSEGGKAALATMRKNYKDAKPSERRKILKEVQRLLDWEKARELSNDPNDVIDLRALYSKQVDQAFAEGREPPAPLANVDKLRVADREAFYRAVASRREPPAPFEERSIAFDKDGDLTNEGAQMLMESEGRTEPTKDGNIHRVSAEMKAADMVVRSNMDGTPRFTDSKVSKAEQTSRKRVLDTLDQWNELPSAPAKKLAARAKVLLANIDKMRATDREAFYQAVASRGDDAPQSPSEASAVVNDLARKYKDVIIVPTKAAAEPSRPAPKEIGVEERLIKDDFSGLDTPEAVSKFLKDAYSLWENGAEDRTVQKYLNEMFDTDAFFNTDVASFYDGMKGGDADLHHDEIIAKLKAESLNAEGVPPSPKAVAAKKAALTEKALSGDKALVRELSTSDDAKGLQRAAVALAEGAADSTALDVVNKRLAELVKDPDTAYGMQLSKYSLEKAGADAKGVDSFKAAKDYLTTATPWVKTVLKNMSHAGDFERVGAEDVVRLSTHALNPTSTAYHESLHAFFAKLSDAGAHDVMGVLERAASTERVMKQMREFLKNEPEALKQLSDPEERAAYMYQMHALGELKLGPAATTVMGRIKAMIMQALGMWTNDERALHIMEYFQSGEYAKNMGSPNAVHRAMMEKGTNKAVTKVQELLQPLNDLGQAVVGIGSQRLRDTGIPALNEVANLIKATGREEHADKGILPTARDERAVRLNAISKKLEPYSNEHLADALNAMQRGEKAATAEGRIAQREVQKALADTLKYMQEAGVNISHIGAKDGVPYFPRVWDIDYISKNQSDFLNMLSKYERQGKLTGAKTLMNEMIARDGAEFGVETREPGMQFKKERLLSFIEHADAAEFMSKDLYQTLNSYITQATRRAEWTRRFGDGGEKLTALLDKAKEQGAQEKHLELTEQYLKGVDGTLGDSLNPRARRLMGDMVVYQNIRLLPLAIFSSIVDPAGLVVNGASVKEAWSTFKRGIKEIPLGFKDQTKIPKDHWTDMAETLGVIDNAVLHNSIGALYSHGMVGDTARKINDGFFRLNLMEQFNRSMRIGATEAAVKFIAKQADGGSPHSQRWLAELGLKASDIKKHEGGLAFMEEHGLSKEEAVKMRAAINQWVDGAVLRPDAADKPIWMNDPHFMLIAHLKQFMYSFHQTILKKVGHEFTHGNSGPAIALASYVPIMIAADAAKGMIQGGGGQPEFKEGWSFADYVWSGLQRAGVFGVGQMGIDVATDIHRGGVGLGAVTGPTIGQLTDVVELTGGHKQFAPVALHALPANALYGGLVKGGAKADPMFAD
jgi:hypothetical protein